MPTASPWLKRELLTTLKRPLVRLPLRCRLPAQMACIMFCLLTACSTGGFRQRSAAELLADPRFAWLTDSTAHTRVHYLPRTPAADDLARLKLDIEMSWARAAEFVGATQENRVIDVFAVPRREMVGEAAGLPIQTNSLDFWEQRVIVAWVPPHAGLGPHEFVHIMAYDAWGLTEEWWLGEGVAVAAGPWNGVDVDVYTKCLGNAGKLMPLGAIVRNLRNPDAQTARVAYPEAGSFVRFLIERYSREKMAQLYSRGAAALPAIYDKSLVELDAEWRQHLATVDSGTTTCPVT
jgi:hypothetical protein